MRRLLPLALLLLAPLAGCGGDEGGAAGGKMRVVATTSQVADLVRNVGGARVEVRQLLSVGADPHGYEPKPSDARALAQAELVFRSGGDLDEWLGDLVDNAGGDADVVTLIDSVRTRGGAGAGGDHDDEVDPHWWQDPRNAVLAVTAIRDELVRHDPAGRAEYRRSTAEYVRRLRRLDAQIARCMAQVPKDKRKLVTTHDSLGYFAARYDVEVVGALIPSLSTQAQPSARDIARLVDQIRDEGVEAIFPETALNPKLERAVSRDADARVGRSLWADSLGPKGSDGATYLGAMASNTEALVEGMTGGERSCRPRV